VFVIGGLLLVMGRDEASPAKGSGRDEAPQIVAQPIEPKPAMPVQAQTAEAGASGAPIRKLTPDQVKDLQRRIQEAQQKKQQQEGGAEK
jgi:hypothetical protein